MPLITRGQRHNFRRTAWDLTCSGAIQWITLALAICSSGLALARSQIDTDNTQRWLFGFEFGCLILSYAFQYGINIDKIENLRVLHAINAKKGGFSDGYYHEDGNVPTNGLTKGISGPTNTGLLMGIGGTIASAITFFKGYVSASEIIGVATPILASTISGCVAKMALNS